MKLLTRQLALYYFLHWFIILLLLLTTIFSDLKQGPLQSCAEHVTMGAKLSTPLGIRPPLPSYQHPGRNPGCFQHTYGECGRMGPPNQISLLPELIPHINLLFIQEAVKIHVWRESAGCIARFNRKELYFPSFSSTNKPAATFRLTISASFKPSRYAMSQTVRRAHHLSLAVLWSSLYAFSWGFVHVSD